MRRERGGGMGETTSTFETIGPITLEGMDGGSVPKRFADLLERVKENILDEQTDPVKRREIVLKFGFVPNEQRTHVTLAISCVVKLEAPAPRATMFTLGRKNGKALALEVKQESLFDRDLNPKGGVH